MRVIPHLIMACFLAIACNTKYQNNFGQFDHEPKSNISIGQLELNETVFEQLPSSYIGQAKIHQDTLYFVDQKFIRILKFDKDLNFLEWHLEKGNGPNDYSGGGIDGFEITHNGNFMFLGAATDWHIYDRSFKKLSSFIMENTKKRANLTTISPANPVIYSFVYPKLIVRESNGRLFFNIMVQHPDFNFIDTHKEYYLNARVLSEMNPESGVTQDIFGSFPPTYHDNDFTLNHVSLLNFDVSKTSGHFYLNFEADPTIYEYDSDFQPVRSFGITGNEMNYNYKKLDNIKDFQREIDKERDKAHFFTWLEYIEEEDLLFRSYSLGQNEQDGLQIYKGNILIGDVNVPKGLKIIGKLGDQFISHPISDEKNDRMIIYTFKLNENE